MDRYVKVEDVMSFINTSNRGNSDYFIVDQIEDLCKNKAKTLEELKAKQDAKKEHDTKEGSKKVVAKYSYDHSDGDQCWYDSTTFYQLSDGTFQGEYFDGYYGKTDIFPVTYDKIVEKMRDVEKQAERRKRSIEAYGYNDVFTRSGYTIDVPFQKEEEIPLDSDLETLFKKNHVNYCHYSYSEHSQNVSVVVVFKHGVEQELYKKNVLDFFHQKGIENIHFSETLDRNVDMDWNLLYSDLRGVVNEKKFEEVCDAVKEEEEIER